MDKREALNKLLDGMKCKEKNMNRILESNGIIFDILDDLEEGTFEEVADKLSDATVVIGDVALDAILDSINDTESPEFWTFATMLVIDDEEMEDLMEIEVIQRFGEAYGKLGIPVENLPEIGLQDKMFLEGYLKNFPMDGRTVIKGDPDYKQEMRLFGLLERRQKELDLRIQKDEQGELTDRSKQISGVEEMILPESPEENLE